MGSRFARYLSVLCMALLWAAGSTPAFAFTQSNFVSFTLEGCRNDGTITLPNGSGQFICPDAAYTTGNLGKGWNELDLVPHRLTTKAGDQRDVTTTYDVYVAADYNTSAKIGYDVISMPTVNAAKSDASCSVTAGLQSTQGSAGSPFGGGTDIVVYRQLTVHQAPNTTCVFDYYQRLALGAHFYPGSSLQSYMFDQEGLSGGKKTISIPVTEILPQSLAKDMTATQGSDHAWSVTKGPAPAGISFGDVCASPAPSPQPLTITVTWTKYPAVTGGDITVITNVYATNPSARVITTNVTDVIYSGTESKDTATSGDVDVPANTTKLILTHTTTVPDGTTALNDIATATYTDKVTGVAIPGTTTAKANAVVQATGPETDNSVSINDQETITGAGLTFSVAQPASGDFDLPYLAGTPTADLVSWIRTGVTDSGSVTFNKTIYLAGPVVTSGTLSDTASAVETYSYGSTASGPYDVAITSTSTSTLTINKSYSKLTLGSGEKLVFSFRITRASDSSFVEKSISFSSGGATSGSIVMAGLPADIYVIDELPTVFYRNGCNDSSCSLVVPVADPIGSATVDLTTKDGVPTCSGSATFKNEPVASAFPSAQVEKITLPDSSGTWAFTLNRPDGPSVPLNSVVANKGFFNFGVPLSVEGTYTVIETEQTGWDLISGVPNDGTNTKVCSFTVKFPQDLMEKTFSCTFTNYQRGSAKVVKTVSGAPPSGSQSFTFELRQGASTASDGTVLETVNASSVNGWTINFTTSLVANAKYQMCERVMPGWNTSLGSYGVLFVPNSIIPPALPNPNVNNMTVCVDFTVAPGEAKTFTVDNSPPPGGRALTIGFWKNWASCSKSKGVGQKPVLDQTLAAATVIGDDTDGHSVLPGVVVSAGSGSMFKFGPKYWLVLHGSTETPNTAPDCGKAVNLLDKSTIDAGKKMASDPAFNLAAQLLAAELNHIAGAYSNPVVVDTINKSVLLLAKYKFDGKTHSAIPAAEATLMNNYAKMLDDYNNNR